VQRWVMRSRFQVARTITSLQSSVEALSERCGTLFSFTAQHLVATDESCSPPSQVCLSARWTGNARSAHKTSMKCRPLLSLADLGGLMSTPCAWFCDSTDGLLCQTLLNRELHKLQLSVDSAKRQQAPLCTNSIMRWRALTTRAIAGAARVSGTATNERRANTGNNQPVVLLFPIHLIHFESRLCVQMIERMDDQRRSLESAMAYVRTSVEQAQTVV
jgi:hypothetical protein